MSHILESIKDINRAYEAGMAAGREVADMTDLSLDPRNIIRRSREVIDQTMDENLKLKAHVRDLQAALARMVKLVEDSHADSEGRYPVADSGCIECTDGRVPDRYNTGKCALHRAKDLLA